jgi:hypothetical protein
MSGRSVLADDELEEEDLELETGDDDEEESEEEESSSETETPQQPAQNLDYESRFKGLQGSLQQQIEQNRQLQAQLVQVQAAQQYQNYLAQGATPEQATAAVQSQVAQFVLQQQGNNINTEKAALEEASRVITAQGLAIVHGIDVKSPEFARLAKFKDPEDMQAFAETLAKSKQTTTKKVAQVKRKATQADKFGSARSSGSAPKTKPKSLGDAADKFSKIKIEI